MQELTIVRVHETTGKDNTELLQRYFKGKQVGNCGVAHFPPHFRAHEGDPHIHDVDEVFIILSGELVVPVDDGGPQVTARTGDWVHIPKHTGHHVRNETELPVACIWMELID